MPRSNIERAQGDFPVFEDAEVERMLSLAGNERGKTPESAREINRYLAERYPGIWKRRAAQKKEFTGQNRTGDMLRELNALARQDPEFRHLLEAYQKDWRERREASRGR